MAVIVELVRLLSWLDCVCKLVGLVVLAGLSLLCLGWLA